MAKGDASLASCHGQPVAPEPLQTCFAPVVRPDVRVLVLGSLPGAMSLAAARYYAHPRNQFWRLMGAVIERDLEPLGYEARLQALLDARVGLWDTVAEGRRRGSLDAAIRLERASDLAALVSDLPALEAIGFNGSTAARVGRGQIEAGGQRLIDLPSSSPALTWRFERKLERWLELRAFL